jgi:FtsP/CotA-like multicopper oxidase with cupredoxin domain
MIATQTLPHLDRQTFAGVRVYSAALLTLGAAFIHLAVAPAHLREYVPFGLFFLAVGSAQIVLAVELVSRPTRRLALILAMSSLGLVALWFVSRTVGLPIGPTPGKPEDVGLTDVICNVMEIISSILFLGLFAWPARRSVRRLWRVALGTFPTALLSLALTSLAVSVTLNDMPEAASSAPPIDGQPSTSITSLKTTTGDQPVKRFTLTAAVTQIDGQEAWALNGTVPGPELRVNQGDRVQVTLVNHLPESTTLHWHGVMVPNAEDGVAGVTQDAVQPGAEYTYEFVANETGTFWYHSHQQTESQLPRGLFGPLVVLPTDSAQQQRDYTLMLHGSAGQTVSINGETDDLHLDALPGETVRLRLIDAVDPGMDGGPEAPVLIGATYQVVALDGRDLNAPDALGPARIPLGMGQRADLVFTMPSSGSVRLIDTEIIGATSAVQKFFTGDTQPKLATVTIGSGDAPTADTSSAPLFDALHYGAAAPDPVATTTPDQIAPVLLGEHPGIRDGRPQLVHTINDAASPNIPPITVEEGQIIRLHIVNNTGEYHPMHLHGHVLSVIAVDGDPPAGSPIHLDSVLVGPNQTVDVAFAANNPGVWMFHCHVLLHAGMGMTTGINYAGYSTPFEMGTRSGNMPE